MEDFLGCMGVVAVPGMLPNRSSDEIKKKHLIGQTNLVTFLGHIDTTETT